jgi:hypothetical protein
MLGGPHRVIKLRVPDELNPEYSYDRVSFQQCKSIIIKYIHSPNTSTTFYKVSTGYMFSPLGPSSGLTYEQVPLHLVHFGIPNCYKDVIKILCAT